MGIIPARFTTLDMLRVEIYLLFYPYDNFQKYPFENEGPGDTLWELGLDFTVSPGKTGFRGAKEHYRLKARSGSRFLAYCLKARRRRTRAPVFSDGCQVGVATCSVYSPLVDKAMAIARLDVHCASPGTQLEVRNKAGAVKASAQPLPFDDPKKLKRTAKG